MTWSPAPDLETALAKSCRGEVRFDEAARAVFATDASNYRRVPIGVVAPVDADDVAAALEVCRRFDVPVLPRGAGTSLAGQGCNVAVVLDTSRHMGRIGDLDPGSARAWVEPGVVLDALNAAVAAHGLVFGPDPATHGWCTLGGMIGNNACGIHSLVHGKTADHVFSLDIITYHGRRLRLGRGGIGPGPDASGAASDIEGALRELARDLAPDVRQGFPRIPRRISGYNLDALLPEAGFDVGRSLVGSEGTCAVVLGAEVSLAPVARARGLVVLGYRDIVAAARAVPEVLRYAPHALEGIEGRLLAAAGGADALPDAASGGALLVEVAGDGAPQADALARRLAEGVRQGEAVSVTVISDAAAQQALWHAREEALGAASRGLDGRLTWPGWEDSAVAPEALGDYLADLKQLISDFGYDAAFYGHFGEGCVHARISFDLFTASGIARFRGFITAAAHLVVHHGGCLSGEHGDGQARSELLEIQFGPRITDGFRRFKAIWDPAGRMNPGNVVDPRPLDADLRLAGGGSDGPPGSAVASECVGIGKCRRPAPAAMCPTYQVTGEEDASTRGRARLLYDMSRGHLAGGRRSRALARALDLCLGCKACKTDCPAGVDMAAFRVAHLARSLAGRPRGRRDYVFGLLPWWSRIVTRAPGLAAAAAATPAAEWLAKALGVSGKRSVPRPARRPFRAWAAASGQPGAGGWLLPRSRLDGGAPGVSSSGTAGSQGGPASSRAVVLWPDCLTNTFHPAAGVAAARLLGAVGIEVVVPARDVCCGRPVYEHGFTDQAAGLLHAAAVALEGHVRAGGRVVVLEPSCLSMLRDEATALLPGFGPAQALTAGARSLAEVLIEATADRPELVPAVGGKATLHVHCHQQALWGAAADEALLDRSGVAFDRPQVGCCGMAGAFGFAPDKVEVSVACGEVALLPAVRAAGADTVIVADGFSCREQIRQTTGRRGVHLAEVLASGL